MKIERIQLENLASSPESLAARLRREKALFTNTAVNFDQQRRDSKERARNQEAREETSEKQESHPQGLDAGEADTKPFHIVA